MSRPRKPWFRKQNSTWYVEINGRQVKLAVGRENKPLAEAEFHRLMVELSANPPLDVGKDRLTVVALLDGYLEHQKGNLAARTWYERRRILQLFAQFCVDRRIALVHSVLPLHLEEFILLHPSWKSADTRAEVVKSVKCAFSWGHVVGIAHPSPFTGKVSYGFRNSRRPMTEQEFTKLIGACGPALYRLREFLTFCFYTGARPSEARSARWSELDLDAGTITLREHKTAKTRREPKPRVIYLDGRVVKLLIEVRRRDGDREFVFTSRLGRPYHRNSVAQNLKRLRRKVGLPEDCKLYGCRHGFGTRAILNGCDLATLAELMGHARGSRVTGGYVHLAGQVRHLKGALDRINSSGNSGGDA